MERAITLEVCAEPPAQRIEEFRLTDGRLVGALRCPTGTTLAAVRRLRVSILVIPESGAPFLALETAGEEPSARGAIYLSADAISDIERLRVAEGLAVVDAAGDYALLEGACWRGAVEGFFDAAQRYKMRAEYDLVT